MSIESDRLEDLSAEILSRGSILTQEQITGFRLSIARMEGKLDAALALRQDLEDHEKVVAQLFAAVNATTQAQALAIGRLESFRGVMLWVGGLVSGSLVAVISALAYYVINHP